MVTEILAGLIFGWLVVEIVMPCFRRIRIGYRRRGR